MNEVSVISYNIWFDPEEEELRIQALTDIIKMYQPDVICLQEVKPSVLVKIQDKLKKEYKCSFPKKIRQTYGCVIITKHQIQSSIEFDYPNSQMGRGLQIISCTFPLIDQEGGVIPFNLHFANSHFESVFKHKVNKEKIDQYGIVKDVLNTCDHVIFCSDTNAKVTEDKYFLDTSELSHWSDVWEQIGTKKNKFTYDSYSNIYLMGKSAKYKARLDRIVYKSKILQPDHLELINYLSVPYDIEPSDHFGLFAKFKISLT